MTYKDQVLRMSGSNLTNALCDAQRGLMEFERLQQEKAEAFRSIGQLESTCNQIKNKVNRSEAKDAIIIATIVYISSLFFKFLDGFLLTLLYGVAVWCALYVAASNDRAKNGAKYEAEANQYYNEHYPSLKRRHEEASYRLEQIRYYLPYQHAIEILPEEYRHSSIVEQLISISGVYADSLTGVFQYYKEDLHRQKMAELEREKAKNLEMIGNEIHTGNVQAKNWMNNLSEQLDNQHRDNMRIQQERNNIEREKQKDFHNITSKL